jgi:hypothetical protein
MRFTPILNQIDWKSRRSYGDHSYWGTFDPELWVLHYGGGRNPYVVDDWPGCAALMRSWQRYHMDTKGWSDIAYNYTGDPESGKPVRLRGENANGANTGSSYWGNRTRTFVFTVNNDEVPRLEQRLAFARMWIEHPLPVTGHGLLPGVWHNGSYIQQQTDCPGDWLKNWIASEGWITDLHLLRVGQWSRTARSVRKRLHALGYSLFRHSDRYTVGMRGAVVIFQTEHQLTPDGIIGPATFRAMAAATPRATRLRWWKTRRLMKEGPL